MYPIDSIDKLDTDLGWHNFERTGSVLSYLTYKGVGCADQDFSENYMEEATTPTNIRDGEPIGYC